MLCNADTDNGLRPRSGKLWQYKASCPAICPPKTSEIITVLFRVWLAPSPQFNDVISLQAYSSIPTEQRGQNATGRSSQFHSMYLRITVHSRASIAFTTLSLIRRDWVSFVILINTHYTRLESHYIYICENINYTVWPQRLEHLASLIHRYVRR
jgi:hypothetical protein